MGLGDYWDPLDLLKPYPTLREDRKVGNHWETFLHYPNRSNLRGTPRGTMGENMRKRARDVQRDIASAGFTTPAAAASTTHDTAISALTTNGTVNTLATAMALNQRIGRPVKKTSKISSHKKSKYASDTFARNKALDILTPKLKLHMHIGILDQFTCASGVQGVLSTLTRECTWPNKDFLAQIYYKMSIDLNNFDRGTLFFTNNTAAVGESNLYVHTGTGADMIAGGSFQGGTTGFRFAPDPTVSRNLANDHKFNNYPGLIMKYFTKTHTFMNVCTNACTLQAYEFILRDDFTGTIQSPADMWSRSLLQDRPIHELTSEIYPKSLNVVNTTTTLGERPSLRHKELTECWRLTKVTTYSISPGQSLMYSSHLPGCYYTMREIFQDDDVNFVRNKCMSVMFILNGELAFEGGAPTTSENQGAGSKVIGTAGATLNVKVESTALFQAMPPGQSYQEIVCHEDLTTAGAVNHSLKQAVTLLPSAMECAWEHAESADKVGGGAAEDNTKVN